MDRFEVVLAARVHQPATSPVLTEINRLVVKDISYTEELNRPGVAALVCPVESLSENVKTYLNSLDAAPCEVWVYYDGVRVWAGEIQSLGIQDQSVTLNCVGLLGYTNRMFVTSTLTYAAQDQFTIAKGLVDHWQALSYGNYGLNTSGIGVSTVVRDRTYEVSERHNIGTRLQELGAVDQGFDTYVDPVTRELVLQYPFRGQDLSASVFLDERNIDSADIVVSVAPGELVSDGIFVGTAQGADGQGQTLVAQRSNATLRAAFGRSGGSASYDGVSVLATLQQHGDAFLSARSQQFFQPGVTVIPRAGCRIGDVHPGDLVSYSYDAGIGLQAGVFRVAKVRVSVAESGKQRLGLEFV